MRSKAVIVARVLLGSSLRLRPERVFMLVPTADDEGRRRRGVHGWGRYRRVLLPAAFWEVYDHGAALLTGRFVPLALTCARAGHREHRHRPARLSDRRFNTNSNTSRSALLRRESRIATLVLFPLCSVFRQVS